MMLPLDPANTRGLTSEPVGHSLAPQENYHRHEPVVSVTDELNFDEKHADSHLKDDLQLIQPHASKHLVSQPIGTESTASLSKDSPAWSQKLRVALRRLDEWGFEATGIERVPANQRTQKSVIDCFTFWMAANCNISTFTLGTLGNSIFGLSLRDAACTIIFFNLVSTVPVAYCSSFGARSGLRQIVFSRFAFGYWVCMILGALNVFATIGWTVINTVVGAEALRSVSKIHPLPMWLGIILLSFLALMPSFAGYKYIQTYQRYAWLAPAVIFVILLGEGWRHMSPGNQPSSESDKISKVFSFGASVVGFGLAWISFAADYTVNLPEDTSAWSIFVASYFGLNVPLILVECLGAAMMTTLTSQADWALAYQTHGTGGLIQAGLSPLGGFGGFLTLIMGLSVVGNNIPNVYSLALSAQVFGRRVEAVPRSIITLVGLVVSITLTIVGASRFDAWLDSVLVILSYWLAIYAAILLEYHLFFQRGQWSRYNWEDVHHASRLPLGAAALASAGVGVIGAIMGMSQKWFTGPIGKRIGSGNGADIGFELAFAFTAVSYPALWFLERRYIHRSSERIVPCIDPEP